MSSFEEEFKSQVQQQQRLQQVIAERLPLLLDIPMNAEGTIEVDGTTYMVLNSYDNLPGYMLVTEVLDPAPTEQVVLDTKVLFVPEVQKAHELLVNNPMELFKKLADLADDETVPADIREELAVVKTFINL